jgi:hypothetical protein
MYFSDSSLEILVAGGDNEASMLLHSFYDAIISVGTFMVAF